MRGHKHLVRCRCVLPQFKSAPNPPRHQFMVFSIVRDDESIQLKYAQCNNCGTVHKVTDICVSEIISGKETMGSIVGIEDIKPSLPPDLVGILERNNCELAAWEHAQFIFENKLWGEFVLLAQEEEEGTKQGKYVRLMGEKFFKVETFSRKEVLEPKGV